MKNEEFLAVQASKGRAATALLTFCPFVEPALPVCPFCWAAANSSFFILNS
jgi:hypothetical protein